MIRVVHTGSRYWFFTHPESRIPDPGSWGEKGTGTKIWCLFRIESALHLLKIRKNYTLFRIESALHLLKIQLTGQRYRTWESKAETEGFFMTFWPSPSVGPMWRLSGGRSRLRESRERASFFFGDSSFTEPGFEICDSGFEDEEGLLASLGASEESTKRGINGLNSWSKFYAASTIRNIKNYHLCAHTLKAWTFLGLRMDEHKQYPEK